MGIATARQRVRSRDHLFEAGHFLFKVVTPNGLALAFDHAACQLGADRLGPLERNLKYAGA
jgi:hypothetical protein